MQYYIVYMTPCVCIITSDEKKNILCIVLTFLNIIKIMKDRSNTIINISKCSDGTFYTFLNPNEIFIGVMQLRG